MAKVSIKIVTEPVAKYLRGWRNRLPMGVARAMNNTMKVAQVRFQDHMRSIFTIRRTAYILKYSNKITFAKVKGDVTSIMVSIEIPSKNAIAKLEEGLERSNKVLLPNKNSKFFQASDPAFSPGKLFTKSDPLNPKNLAIPYQKGRGRAARVYGTRSDVYATNYGIYQTLGTRSRAKGRTSNGDRLLFRLVRRTKAPAILKFKETIVKTFDQVLPDELRIALATSLTPKAF